MKIKTVDREYSCDDGCCHDFWVGLYIDELYEGDFPTELEALTYFLTKLGYEVQHEYEE